jgi:RNA polymerase sigma-70 factor (ECF subfamily)
MFASQDLIDEIPRLRRYARALTGNAARADDLVQDTLERALGKRLLWRPGNLRAWLFAMMHNLFVNERRCSREREPREADMLSEVPVRATQSDGLELRDLDRTLQQLPAEQRAALLLVGMEALSYREAAKVLGVPVGTVMSRLSRARERLRALLAEGEAAVALRVVK